MLSSWRISHHIVRIGIPFRNYAMAMTERSRTCYILPYSIRFSYAGRVSDRIDQLPIFAFCPPAFRFQQQIQSRIPPHLVDDAHLLFEQGQNQAFAHEPGVDQQAHLLDVPPDRIDQLPRYSELAALTRLFDQPGANWHRQRRVEPNAHDQYQRDPTLAVQKNGSIGFAAVVLFDTDIWPRFRRARNQRIIDDLIRQFTWKHPLHQLQQTDRQVYDRYMRPLDQLVIDGPVRLTANGPDSMSDSTFRVEHVTDQEFDGSVAEQQARGKKIHSESSRQTEAVSDMMRYPRSKIPH